MSDMRRVGRLVGDKIGCNGVNTGRLLLWVPEITVVGEFPDKRKGGGGELSFDDSMSSDPKVLEVGRGKKLLLFELAGLIVYRG